ncbi:hypothetical protein Aduo_018492 [Ancylostoma duodenale]
MALNPPPQPQHLDRTSLNIYDSEDVHDRYFGVFLPLNRMLAVFGLWNTRKNDRARPFFALNPSRRIGLQALY